MSVESVHRPRTSANRKGRDPAPELARRSAWTWMDSTDTVVNVIGIVHREEDPELRRHRQEVLEKSRVWRVVVVLCAVAVGAALVWALVDILFG